MTTYNLDNLTRKLRIGSFLLLNILKENLVKPFCKFYFYLSKTFFTKFYANKR